MVENRSHASPVLQLQVLKPTNRLVSTRRLTLLYIIALSLIGLLTITGQIVVQVSLVRLTSDSTVVNIAGRQRMLSQRLAKLVMAASVSKTLDQRQKLLDQLRLSLDQWRQAQNGLQNGDNSLKLPGNNSQVISAMFEGLETDFRATESVVDECLVILESGDPDSIHPQILEPLLERLLPYSEMFLSGMDAIVSQYETEARTRVARLRMIERGLLIATLLVLLCEGFLVFFPAVDSIRRGVASLRTLTDELSIAKKTADDANRAKSQFLTQMSHELRTPLHGVLGLVGLARTHSTSRRVRNWLATSLSSAKTLKELVDDLLDLASIESGRSFVIHNRPVALRKLLKSCAISMRLTAERKGLALIFDQGEKLPECVLADRHRIKQIVFNLIQNAIRYTESGSITLRSTVLGDPTLSLEPKTASIVIEVLDTGRGLSFTDRSTLLHEFASIHNSSDPFRLASNPVENPGDPFGSRLGLGLSITAGLVQAMGGKIELESDPGKGSCFRVILPLVICDPPEKATLGRTDQKTLKSRPSALVRESQNTTDGLPTILLVDDDTSNQFVMKAYLDQLGLRSVVCANGQEAIRLAAKNTFVAFVLDRRLPDIDGIELAKQLSRSVNVVRSPILLVSADNPESVYSDMNGSPIASVLSKPLSYKTLRRELERLGVISQVVRESSNVPGRKAGTQNESLNYSKLREELRVAFHRDFASQFAQLKEACHKNQASNALLIAHRMRGSAANAGLAEIGRVAEKIEVASRSGKMECHDIQRLLDDMEMLARTRSLY